ncbi:unnamed protein product, partial [Meganyctiphanes norvegica]
MDLSLCSASAFCMVAKAHQLSDLETPAKIGPHQFRKCKYVELSCTVKTTFTDLGYLECGGHSDISYENTDTNQYEHFEGLFNILGPTEAEIHTKKHEESCQERKRSYVSWDDYFMAVSFLTAMRSKDPATQVGACIVNQEKKIVGIGYNGMPSGCNDNELPWVKESKDPLQTKYMYVCHAELNAIMNKNSADLKGCKIYVALFPCNECAKLVIQSGIREVVYFSDKHSRKPETIASKLLMDLAGVKYRKNI